MSGVLHGTRTRQFSNAYWPLYIQLVMSLLFACFCRSILHSSIRTVCSCPTFASHDFVVLAPKVKFCLPECVSCMTMRALYPHVCYACLPHSFYLFPPHIRSVSSLFSRFLAFTWRNFGLMREN